MVGKGDDFGFLFLKNGSRFERMTMWKIVKEVHLSSAVSADEGHFSMFFIGIYDYAKRKY